jgi:hypothetical protein
MDPITAIGFAASILTFVDFSVEIITGTKEVIKSGSTTENAHVDVVINDLHDVTKKISSSPVGILNDEKLISLAGGCQVVSKELQDLLEKLKVQTGSSKWKIIRIALRSMRKKEDVAGLEKRLTGYRSQILLRLLLILK